MTDRQIIILILLSLNTAFFVAIWHIDVNFVGKKIGEKQTNGIFKIKTEDAHRYCEYLAMAIFLLMDTLFVWKFL